MSGISTSLAGTRRAVTTVKWIAVILLIILGVLVVTAGVLAPLKPSNDRDWVALHARMPHAQFAGSHVRIENVRNFRHVAPDRFDVAYESREYDLDRLESVWFIVTPFEKRWRGPAHSFVSFGFRGDSTAAGIGPRRYLAISVEARRERGETYSILSGLLKRYEVLYVVGDERDLIGQRAVVNGDETELYPIRTTPEKMRRMFVSMLERANALREHPEFYNTATNNCTSNIIAHVNAITPDKVPYGIKTILPGYADEVAAAVGLLDAGGSIDAARRRYRINERAKAAWGRPDFSDAIRR